jgi:hypothetical protein
MRGDGALYDEDGIDGPFDRAMSARSRNVTKKTTKTETTATKAPRPKRPAELKKAHESGMHANTVERCPLCAEVAKNAADEDKARGARMLAALNGLRASHPLLGEYTAEAEHSDGPEYWERFTDVDAVLRDFDLYVQNVETDRAKLATQPDPSLGDVPPGVSAPAQRTKVVVNGVNLEESSALRPKTDLEWLELVSKRLIAAVTDPIDGGDDAEGLTLLEETERRLIALREGKALFADRVVAPKAPRAPREGGARKKLEAPTTVCPACGAQAGEFCKSGSGGKLHHSHKARSGGEGRGPRKGPAPAPAVPTPQPFSPTLKQDIDAAAQAVVARSKKGKKTEQAPAPAAPSAADDFGGEPSKPSVIDGAIGQLGGEGKDW